MKRFAHTKRKCTKEYEVHLQLIADGNDSAMQSIAHGDGGYEEFSDEGIKGRRLRWLRYHCGPLLKR